MSKGFNDFTRGGNRPHDRRNRDNRSVERNPLAYNEVIMGALGPRDTGETLDLASVIIANAATVRQEAASNWDEKACMSFDGLFRPVSLHGSGGLPRFAQELDCPDCPKTGSRGAQPPLNYSTGEYYAYNLEINSVYLNPLINPTGEAHGIHSGHDFDVIARDGDMETGNAAHISMVVTELNGVDPYSHDYRFIAHKGPMIMQGWGYDIDGKPIPNAADNEADAEAGIFTNENLKDQFMDDWLKKSSTWPVGPVDLVWDRTRRVWTARPAYKVISAKLKTPLTVAGLAYAYQDTGSALWDDQGNIIYLNETNNILVKNKTYHNLSEGDSIICYWDTDACEYWVINGYVTPTTTSSTTTTFLPVSDIDCTGVCYWRSDDGINWILDSGDCGFRPTTTTTTIAPTTTTTDTGYIDCTNPSIYTTTTTSNTTTTAAGTTTTTERPLCECVAPPICPYGSGDTLITYCTDNGTGEPPNDCDTGTTTSTTTTCPPCDCNQFTTTTTTVDPGSTTTTTTEAPCTGNCEWRYINCELGNFWIPISNDCSAYEGCTHADCCCAPPDEPATQVCETFTSSCSKVTTTTTLPPRQDCIGGCLWFYIPELDTFCGVSHNCPPFNSDGDPCYCPPPTLRESCGYYGSPCIKRNRETTTTNTTVDPCWACCDTGSTTTTTSAPTTTTLPPCFGTCEWICIGGFWALRNNDCPITCSCPHPGAGGACSPFSSSYTYCNGDSTSTTSSTTTTEGPGACCQNIGPCYKCWDNIRREDCPNDTHNFHPGVLCSSDPCNVPCGKCCAEGAGGVPVCAETTEEICLDIGGAWYPGEECPTSGSIGCDTPTTTTTTTTTTAAPQCDEMSCYWTCTSGSWVRTTPPSPQIDCTCLCGVPGFACTAELEGQAVYGSCQDPT